MRMTLLAAVVLAGLINIENIPAVRAQHDRCDLLPSSPLCDHDRFFGEDDRIVPRFRHLHRRRSPFSDVKSCRTVARWLSAQGFSRIQPTDCYGLRYGFIARRRGKTYELRVDSDVLRIASARRLR